MAFLNDAKSLERIGRLGEISILLLTTALSFGGGKFFFAALVSEISAPVTALGFLDQNKGGEGF